MADFFFSTQPVRDSELEFLETSLSLKSIDSFAIDEKTLLSQWTLKFQNDGLEKVKNLFVLFVLFEKGTFNWSSDRPNQV